MKQKVVNSRKARTRYMKLTGNAIYTMSVAARRNMGIEGPDSAEYDAKHGYGIMNASKRTLRLGFLRRKQNKGE